MFKGYNLNWQEQFGRKIYAYILIYSSGVAVNQNININASKYFKNINFKKKLKTFLKCIKLRVKFLEA